jgi:hypothetical protein
MGKDGLKLYPLNRYVVDRDGNGNVIEIVTKETISKKLLKKFYPDFKQEDYTKLVDDSSGRDDECDIYTHVVLDNNRWIWHQEVYDKSFPSLWARHLLTLTPGLCYALTT